MFVSLDGPKGAGKTTLLEAITKVLRADNKKVIRLCEKKAIPAGGNNGPREQVRQKSHPGFGTGDL